MKKFLLATMFVCFIFYGANKAGAFSIGEVVSSIENAFNGIANFFSGGNKSSDKIDKWIFA